MAHKIWARVNDKAFNELRGFAKEAGFKSYYQLIQYTVACLLRMIRNRNGTIDGDEEDEGLTDEISQMFYDYSESDRKFDFVKPKRRVSEKRLAEIEADKKQLKLWDE